MYKITIKINKFDCKIFFKFQQFLFFDMTNLFVDFWTKINPQINLQTLLVVFTISCIGANSRKTLFVFTKNFVVLTNFFYLCVSQIKISPNFK